MKLIIITGVNRGLGKAFFNCIINREDSLIIGISRKITQEQEVLLKENKFIFIQLDLLRLSNPKEELNFSNYLEKAEKIVYINNAAIINPINRIGSFKDKEIQNIIYLNTTVPLLITNYLFQIANQKRITIINISSGAAYLPIEGWSLYCASKAANEMFYKTLGLQEKDNTNIKILNIDPGVMDSGMQELIRDTNEIVFPRVKDFIKLKEENKLLNTFEVAKKIILESKIF